MFNNQKEYFEATRYASINIEKKRQGSSRKFLFFNILMFIMIAIIAYYGLHYFNQSKQVSYLTNVMGATHTYNEDQVLIDMLSQVEVDKVAVEHNTTTLSVEMDNIINKSIIKKDSKYIQALSHEINNKSSVKKNALLKERIVTIRKGETLASLALDFYGNSNDFTKIIAANNKLSTKSHIIYVGQSIHIPY